MIYPKIIISICAKNEFSIVFLHSILSLIKCAKKKCFAATAIVCRLPVILTLCINYVYIHVDRGQVSMGKISWLNLLLECRKSLPKIHIRKLLFIHMHDIRLSFCGKTWLKNSVSIGRYCYAWKTRYCLGSALPSVPFLSIKSWLIEWQNVQVCLEIKNILNNFQIFLVMQYK